MNPWIDFLLVFLVLTTLALLGSNRLVAGIRLTAIQGFLLGALTLLAHLEQLTPHIVFLGLGSMVVKAGLIPWLLFRALREVKVRSELEPFVSYTLSVLIGALLLGFSLWLGSRLPVPAGRTESLVAPVAFFTILGGLLVVISRRTALTQVLGYLVLENGIYMFGIALAHEQPLLVELAVLLDLFVAVFVMGITIFHINRAFDHIDVGRLSSLKDSDT